MEGSCHCGRVSWALATPPESITACNCTVCRRYGVLWAYGHIDHDIKTSGNTSTYRRADGGVELSRDLRRLFGLSHAAKGTSFSLA